MNKKNLIILITIFLIVVLSFCIIWNMTSNKNEINQDSIRTITIINTSTYDLPNNAYLSDYFSSLFSSKSDEDVYG